MRYDVFISYSSKDQKIAEGICGYLESNGYRCFVAYRDILRGVVWAGAIADAIDESKMMVVVFSSNFNLSSQTDREIELAADNKIPILTYRISDDKLTGAKKYYLKNLNWIDAFPNPERYFGHLLKSISSLICKEAVNVDNQQKVNMCENINARLQNASEAKGIAEEQKRPEEEEQIKDKVFNVGGVSFKMIHVEGGSFMMGSPDNDLEAWENEKPQHRVALSEYYIGETQVTQALWKAVMGYNPSRWLGDKLPVETVSWYDCQEFMNQLNKKTDMMFRLPTEAEWEYAARGGRDSQDFKYVGGNDIDEVAWYDGNSGNKTHPVKQKISNELGIYDMIGNVCEWCQDLYGNYSDFAQTNPSGASSGFVRVFRGGCWHSFARCCRVTWRSRISPDDRSGFFGFRLALDK